MGDYGSAAALSGDSEDVCCGGEAGFAAVAAALAAQQLQQETQLQEGGSSRSSGRGRRGGGRAAAGGADAAAASHPDFPTAKTLLIAFRRSRAFLERTAKELLAGGTEYIMLSALGDAIPLAVQLQHALKTKKAAIPVRLETVLVQSRGESSSESGGGVSPGLRIVMQRHPEFKGSRISPGYVMFVGESEEGETPSYEADPTETFACVNAGSHDLCMGSGRRDVAALLEREGFPVADLKELYAQLLARALEESKDKEDADVTATIFNDTSVFPDAKLVVCRPCMILRDVHASGALGSVFVTSFRDKFPHGKPKNSAMVYVVAPRLSHFQGSAEKYLDAVEATATNLMTALCDFNGYVRREGQSGVHRISRCRLHVFPADEGLERFTAATPQQQSLKAEIAKAILRGLEQGYRHGPSPRLSFAHDDDVFRQAWIEATGLDPSANVGVGASAEGPAGSRRLQPERD